MTHNFQGTLRPGGFAACRNILACVFLCLLLAFGRAQAATFGEYEVCLERRLPLPAMPALPADASIPLRQSSAALAQVMQQSRIRLAVFEEAQARKLAELAALTKAGQYNAPAGLQRRQSLSAEERANYSAYGACVGVCRALFRYYGQVRGGVIPQSKVDASACSGVASVTPPELLVCKLSQEGERCTNLAGVPQ